MTLTTAQQIVSKYGRNSKMNVIYNESPLKVINGNKLTVNYLPSNIDDGSWSQQLEEYVETHKAEVIEYFQAQEVIFQHGLKEYLRKHRAVLRPNSAENKLGKKAGEK